MTDIDTELQESGEYEGYYRFVLEGGQQIILNIVVIMCRTENCLKRLPKIISVAYLCFSFI